MSRLVATFFYVGYLRPAPGTWGSAAALPAGYLLHALGGPLALATAILLAFGAGLWATARMTAGAEDHDPSEIVIDEVVGQWLALLPVSWGFYNAGLDPWSFPWPGWVAAFVLFRAFDILKPGPVGWADRRPGPMGVMLDDVIAGIFAGICVMALAGLWHGVLAR